MVGDVMDPADLDKLEAWWSSWFAGMQLRDDWQELRAAAVNLMGRANVEISFMRAWATNGEGTSCLICG